MVPVFTKPISAAPRVDAWCKAGRVPARLAPIKPAFHSPQPTAQCAHQVDITAQLAAELERWHLIKPLDVQDLWLQADRAATQLCAIAKRRDATKAAGAKLRRSKKGSAARRVQTGSVTKGSAAKGGSASKGLDRSLRRR